MSALRHRPALLSLAACAAIAGSTLTAHAQSAQDAVLGLIRSIDASPDWNADYGEVTPSGNGVSVTGIRITGAGTAAVSIELGTLALEGYSARPDGGFAADTIAVDRITVVTATGEFELEDVALADLAVPGIDFVFDAEHPFTAMMQGYSLAAETELASGTIGRMVATTVSEGISSLVTYENFAIGRLADGRLDFTTAGPVTSETPEGEGLVRFEIASIESRGMDLSAIAHVMDPSRYANGIGDGVWRQVLALGRYRDIVIEAPGTHVLVSDITVEDFRMRQPPGNFTGMMDALLANPTMSEQEVAKLMEAGLPDLLSSFALGRFSFENLDIEAPEIERFRIGEFFLDELSAERLGEFGIGDLQVLVPGSGAVNLDSFSIGDIRFPDMELLRRAIAAGTAEATGKGKGPTVDPMDLIPKPGFLEVIGVDLDTDEFVGSLERFLVEMGGYVGFVPTAITMDVRDFDLDVTQLEEEQARTMLEALGYERIVVDWGFDWSWREVDETVSLRGLHFGIEDFGSLTADLELVGLTREAIENPLKFEEALASLQFVSARIVIEDDSITDRAIEWQAREARIEPQAFRTQIRNALPFFLMALQNADFQQRISPTLQAFIDAPGRITVTLRPREPVPFATLMEAASSSPQRLPDLLAIDVETDAPRP